ncbi:MAG TPA: molybdopterin cofactor-binding domain-containing protein, partial [Candidatus Acidoferrum sp.]
MNKPAELYSFEPERYEFRALPMHQFALGRRDFFKVLGAGIAVFAVAKDAVLSAQETAPGPRAFQSEELPKEIGAWLHIGEDGTVTGFVGKAEMGQNVRTTLAQTIADELGVPFESVRMVLADTALTPWDAGTFGSRTTPTITPQLRRVAAATRDLLREKAAKEWNVPADKLVAGDGKITDPASGRSLRYSELAREKLIDHKAPPASDPVKPAPQWTVAGTPIPKVDARAFVTGSHLYSSDLRPDGLLHGKILRPPSFGATLIAYDDSGAKTQPDVVVVHDGDFVGAAAPTVAAAEKALSAIHVQWKEVRQVSDQEIFSYLKKNAQPSNEERFRQTRGSVAEGLASAAHKLDATYNVAYIAHAPLEPRSAVAQRTGNKLTVWMGTQRPFAVRDDLADIFHVPEANVRVIVPDTGSAYGGKHTSDAGLEAARLARAAG